MAINYEDERLQAVENEKQEALTKAEETYGGMIEKAEQIYQEQIDATHAWEEQKKQLQQEQTDFAIKQTQQQKEQAEKDYTKEQSAAYADWQKQKNAYGVNAEQMAAAGLAGSGFAESSQVSMYNTYQMRVAAARESITQAIAEFDSAIQAAMLQNNVAMAQIAADALQKRLTLSLEGFQYQNQLILSLEQEKQAIDQTYYSRWQDVLAQLNAEEAMEIAKAKASSGSGGGREELTLLGGETPDKSGAQEVALTDDGSGGWRREERGPNANLTEKVVIDDSIPKVISEKELERMLDSGEATITRNGNNLVVSKANPLQKQMNTITNAGTERTSPEYYKEQSKIEKWLRDLANALDKVF